MIAFINEHRDTYGVEPICKVLPIAPSTYRLHAGRQRDPSLLPDRARRDLVLMEKIKRVFETNYSVYGARKVWRGLRDRCLRTPDRRMAGEPHGPCKLRSGCPGTGDTCQEARQGIGPRASQRSRCPIRVDQILRAPGGSRDRSFGRQRRRQLRQRVGRNDQRPLQGRGDPPARPVEIVRG